MSNEIVCPYCGNAPWSGVSPQGDSSMRVRCDRCGGIFEYIPGFGAFSLPEMGRERSTMGDISGDSFIRSPGPEQQGDRYAFPQAEQKREGGNCCGTCCCCFILFILLPYLFFFIFIPFGILW